MTTLLLNYWKQIVGAIAIFGLLFYIHHSGYDSGKNEVQVLWDKQKVLDAQVAATAVVKNQTIEAKSETETKNDNSLFTQNVAKLKDYYNLSIMPHINNSTGVRKPAARKTNRSEVPSVPSVASQPDTTSADTVSRTEFDKLANDCLATTLQLNDAKQWAEDQAKIYNQ